MQSVSAAAAEIATAPTNFLFKRPPEEELFERFKAVCSIIDEFASQDINQG